jgi:hypothetical protein
VRLRAAVVALSIITLSSAAAAQSPGLIAIPFRTYVALNPLGIPFDIGSIEVESGVSQGITIGGVGSYSHFGDDRYTTVDLKVRYYPSEVVLNGFSLGMSVGRTHFSTVTNVPVTGAEERATVNFPTLGVLVDYNWMLGARRRFVVGTGLGAKRVLASSERRDHVGLDPAYMTARFVVGLAF